MRLVLLPPDHAAKEQEKKLQAKLDAQKALSSSISVDRYAFADVEIRARGEKIPAHRCILAASSIYFNEQFASASGSPIEIDCRPEILRAAIDSFYGPVAFPQQVDWLIELYLVADLLKAEALKLKVIKELEPLLSKAAHPAILLGVEKMATLSAADPLNAKLSAKINSAFMKIIPQISHTDEMIAFFSRNIALMPDIFKALGKLGGKK